MEKMRALEGVAEIARTLGYMVSAREKMSQGREGEAYADLTRGAGNLLKNWDVISYPVKTLWHAFDPPSFSTVQSALAVSVEARRGFFTGKWDSQPGGIQLIYHDKDTNAITLFFECR
ncbi:MAG TPA: hypothetical protein VK582_00075 [Pyrinomonadaceae bacterium]|nr:hypothetical protein [Pyrinomonadaceae bacterium]